MNIVIAHFSAHWVNTSGGVEKTVCFLSNAMVTRGHSVTILYLGDKEGKPYFPLDKRVHTENILFENGKKVVTDKLPFFFRAYREIVRLFSKTWAREVNAIYKGRQYGAQIRKWFSTHEADVVLSVSPMSAKYLLIDGACQIPTIEMTREDPYEGFPQLSKWERKAIKKTKAIQVLLPSDLAAVERFFPGIPAVSIGNIAMVDALQARLSVVKKRYKITNVGSVCGRKNQKLLVEAFKNLVNTYPKWDVEIWGETDSAYAKLLQSYINQHHLNNRVYLKGTTKYTAQVYADSDIFAYPSKSEGFPNGVIEAMSAGIPVVGLEKCHGTNFLVKEGRNGFLAKDDPLEFSKALQKLMDDADLRMRMGKNSLKETEEYQPEKIWNQWEELMKMVCREE